MPGPFPGMDPYLETPARWQGVHNSLTNGIMTALNTLLPDRYVAVLEARCYILAGEELFRTTYVVPDVAIVRPTQNPETTGSTVTLERNVISYTVEFMPVELREGYVNIVDREQNGRIVSCIEVLSHTNKNPRNEGRRLYLRKQRALIAAKTNLLEIDLLRSGLFTVAVAKNRLRRPHRHDYIACLYRSFPVEEYEVFPISLRDPLPLLKVPLESGIPDVVLDIQSVVDRVYDDGAYARRIDYNEEIEPPLADVDDLWADRLLREKGKR
jgi:Protein of unknown function (DUF4058)